MLQPELRATIPEARKASAFDLELVVQPIHQSKEEDAMAWVGSGMTPGRGCLTVVEIRTWDDMKLGVPAKGNNKNLPKVGQGVVNPIVVPTQSAGDLPKLL